MKYILMLTLIFFGFSGWRVYKYNKDPFNPYAAFLLPVTVSVLISAIYYDHGDYGISSTSYFIYWLGICSFVSGLSFFSNNRCGHNWKGAKTGDVIRSNSFILELYKLISIAGTICSIEYIYRAAVFRTYGNNYLRNIRYYSGYVQRNGPLGRYSIIFIQILFCIYSYKLFVLKDKRQENKRWFAILLICYVINIMTTISRTSILQFLISFIYIVMLSYRSGHKKTNSLRIMAVGVLGFAAMNLFAVMTSKSNITDEITGKSINWMIPYFGKELFIFDRYVLGHAGVNHGIASLGILGRLLHRAGLLVPEPGIDIPNSQVASFIYGPYADFGIPGVMIVMLLCGIFTGYIYRKTEKAGGFWSVFYVTVLYSLLMSFYAFQFMMSSQLYIAVCLLLLMTDRRLRLRIRV